MASEAKYNELAGVNKKEQEKREKAQKREEFKVNLQEDFREAQDNVKDAAEKRRKTRI